jgi:DNA-binding transcriptional regulator YiaG
MAITKRERTRRAFAAMIKERGLTQQQTAALLHVSLDTIKSWLKPETSASSYPVTPWAIELLALKMTTANPAVTPIKKRAAR